MKGVSYVLVFQAVARRGAAVRKWLFYRKYIAGVIFPAVCRLERLDEVLWHVNLYLPPTIEVISKKFGHGGYACESNGF